MTKYLLAVIILLSAMGCKSKKKTAAVQQSETNIFLELYPKLALPFNVADSNLAERADTGTISYEDFIQLVPDTVFNNPFGKNRKLTIHPVGKIEQKGKESYYVTLVNDKSDSAIYLFVINKNKFVVSMPLVTNNDDNAVNSASIDKKLSIVLNKE